MPEPISYWEEIKRKAVHLSSLWMVVFTLLSPNRMISVTFFGLLCVGNLLVEHRYALGKRDVLSRLYHVLFGRMLRKEPEQGAWVVSGAAPVLAAACFANLLFPPIVAASSLAVMLLGDSAAALIGRRYGRHTLVNGKSLEGSLGFLLFGCLGVILVYAAMGEQIPLLSVFFAVFAGMLTELFQKQLRVDDNFSIPAAAGAVLYFFGRIHGF